MIVKFDVLGALVKDKVIGDLYVTSIIGIGWCGTIERRTTFTKELPKLNHLITSRRHGSVLSFNRRFGDCRLFFTF